VSLLDDAHAKALGKTEDLRMTLLPQQLEEVLGEETVCSLAVAFGSTSYDTIKMRRVEAHGMCVPFHTDFSRRTMQVRAAPSLSLTHTHTHTHTHTRNTRPQLGDNF